MLYHVYHLSDDTGHDPSFVDEVLNDIFSRWKIQKETIILKNYNAGNQYKGLIDAMSSFGVKSILRKDIVTGDVW